MLKKISIAGLFLAVACSAFGFGGSPPAQNAETAKLQKLQRDYMTALQAYEKPYENVHTAEEAAKIHLDPKKNPALSYLPKVKTFAQHVKDPNVAVDAWMFVIQVAGGAGNTKEADGAVATLMARYVKQPAISKLAQSLPYMFYEDPKRDSKIVGMLDKIEAGNPDPNVKASALYSKAKLIGGANADEATKIYEEIVAKYPNTSFGKNAKADIYEMQNLVPGKVAPDFEAEDENGRKFKLSDYRGKVVVLDFWGFW